MDPEAEPEPDATPDTVTYVPDMRETMSDYRQYESGIDDIAADPEVRCLVVSIDGIVLLDTVTTAGNVNALCQELGAGTYVVRLTGDNFEKTDKVIIR